MLTFKQFLNEDGSAYSPSELDNQQFIDVCEKSASMYLKATSSSIIYRGFGKNKTPDVGVLDSNLFNRRSANTLNYYTVWMDNNPAWAAYPKRAQGLICTSELNIARGYTKNGNMQIVIPFDNAMIAQCPTPDLWNSFRTGLKSITGASLSEMMDFNMLLEYIIFRKLGPNEVENNYDELSDVLHSLTVDELEKIVDADNKHSRPNSSARAIIYFMKDGNIKNLFDLFDKRLSPELNGFSLLKYVYVDESREIWIQGKCATMEYYYLYGVKKTPHHPLHDFCLKYNLFRALQ